MIESELERLLAQPPDHPLDALQADIWAGVAELERRVRLSRRLLTLQAAVLIAVMTASLLAGAHYRQTRTRGPLDIFSPHMALSVATRLTEFQP